MSIQSFCKVTIPTFRPYEHNSEIILYQIDVQVIGAMQWRVEKRYSDCYDFDTILRAQFQYLPDYPGKTLNKLKTNEQIERRRNKLNNYFSTLSQRIDVVTSKTFNMFFNFEKYASKFIFEPPQLLCQVDSHFTIKNCQYISDSDSLIIVTGQTEGLKQMKAMVQNKDNQIVEPLGSVEMLSLKDNQVKRSWEKLLQLQAQCLHFSDSTLVVGFEKGVIMVYQLEMNLSEPVHSAQYQTHKGRVNGVYYDGNYKIIYSISQDGTLISTYRDFLKHNSQLIFQDELTSLKICEKRQLAFVGSNRGTVHLIDISSVDIKEIVKLENYGKQKISDFALNTTQGYLFLACESNSIQVVDIQQQGKEKHSKFKAHIIANDRAKRIAFCEKRQHLYLGDTTGCITVHNAQQGQPIYSLQAYQMNQSISLVNYIEEKDILVSFGYNELKVWQFPLNWADFNELKYQEYKEIRNEQLNKQSQKKKISEWIDNQDSDDDELHNWHRNSK